LSKENNTLTVNDLTSAFREIGLQQGDSLIIHSSLGSLGHMERGADGVIDALLEAIGPSGNLMLPTFNYNRPLPEPYYDPKNTPCRAGIIPETGRKRQGAIRSLHPTHSVAVIGPDAKRLTDEHLRGRAFGKNSPIDRLVKAGGKVLLLGVAHTSNSTVHIGEEYADIPKCSWYGQSLPMAKVLMPDGKIIEHQLDTSPSCSTAFNAVEYCLRQHSEINDLRIGAAKIQLVSGEAVVRRVAEMIDQKADILLCRWAGCKPCAGARKLLKEAGRII